MTNAIPDAQLSRCSELVALRLGLHFPRERWRDLERGVCAAAVECGWHQNVEGYLQELLSSAVTQDHIEVLASHLTVGETYFFREKHSLEVLADHIVPELMQARVGLGRQIRIWSAGCATGEEPYSVAMMLSKWMAGLKDWNVHVLATDLNTKSLHRAAQGIYSAWSFRDTPPWLRYTHFEAAEDGRCVIVPAIKKMVNFAPLNLMDDTYPPFSNCSNGVDVILCRNVLMYFTPDGRRKVIRQFYRHLAADGWLIVSPTETSHELFSEFVAVNFGAVTLYRKSDSRLPVTAALPVFDLGELAPKRTVEAAVPCLAPIRHTNLGAEDTEPGPTEPGPVIEELPAVSYRQALALYEQGRYEEAGDATAALLSQNGSDAPAMFLLARVYANQGKLSEALAWCDKAIAVDKMAARFHYLRATILQEQSSIPDAILALKQAVYAEPRFVLGHLALGNLALKHGRPDQSEKHFENALLLLAQYEPEDIVPESEGLSAGRLQEMIAMPSADTGRNTFQRAARSRVAAGGHFRNERTVVR